jgi:hypothetical protein
VPLFRPSLGFLAEAQPSQFAMQLLIYIIYGDRTVIAMSGSVLYIYSSLSLLLSII